MIDTLGIGFVWPLFGPLFTGKNSTLFSNAVPMEWRNILYGITIGVASLFKFLSAPILGTLSDRIGRYPVLLGCLFGSVIGMGISILGVIFNQVLLLIFSRAWLGAIAASQVIAQATLIDKSLQHNKSARLGVVSAANNIGFIFGPVISGILVDANLVSWFSLTTPFYFAAILALLCAIFLLSLNSARKLAFGRSKAGSTYEKFTVFSKIFTNKNVALTALTYLCLQGGWALYLQTNFVCLIQKFNYSSRLLSYFLAWLGAVFCFNLLIIVPILVKLVSIRKIIYSNLVLAAGCCFLAAFYNTEIGIWINILPMATAVALGSNGILTNLSNAAREHEQGWAMGVGNSMAALAWAIIPPLTGVILIFGFKLPLIVAGLFFVLGVAIAVFLAKSVK